MMSPGALVADRFEIEALAGSGGMGMVFRAHDRQTGRPVALKMLVAEPREHDTERLLREAQTLSELRHPGIAAYVSHGRTVEGQIFLAMEWLEGEDLSRRLRRQRLGLGEVLTLLKVVASTLATVHRQGIVHRDIKPGNLFLRDAEVERVTLLDFGIARSGLYRGSVTRTGEVVGTLHYIAPEQARGERQVGPSADVFALGCVLHECLLGAPPFAGGHVAVVLTRILCDEVPPLRRTRPELPEALEQLVGRMLAKEPAERYPDGAALLAAIDALGVLGQTELLGVDGAPATQGDARAAGGASLSTATLGAEQQLVSVVLALHPMDDTGARLAVDNSDRFEARSAKLAGLLRPIGARVDHLASGALVATLSQAGETAQDQAAQAVRAAWLLKEQEPEATVVVATGRGVMSGAQPVGEAVERAVRLVGQDEPQADAGPRVWMDELTAGLLDSRFEVQRLATGVYALEQRAWAGAGARTITGVVDLARPLLGKPTPCVGREQELQLIGMVYRGCVEEPTARAVLVVAAPGVGKSRLRHEFMRRLQGEAQELTLLLGRGDPMQAGAAYGLLGEALRHWAGVEEMAEPERRREQLAVAVGRHVAETDRVRVAEFLGELCGLPFPEERSARLRAARQDPRLMSDQVTDAFLTWLGAECAQQPVILILEDLHWGDAATVRLVDTALRELGELPFFVLGLGRPEVHRLFPQLWAGRELQELRLGELGRRASERLVREVLGAQATPEVVSRITAQAGGNALYLEELIRAVAEGGGEELPETLLAMLQARFLRLDLEVRRLLRAASLFGETFWRGGVLALLAGEAHVEPDIDRWLAILVDSEIITHQTPSRLVGETQFGFRHNLLREAAYSLLGEEDRRRGHLLAGQFLERAGEDDPLVLAEHHERGGALAQAATFYTRAATRALEGSDAGGALHMAERAIACGATRETLGLLRSLQSWAHLWARRFGEALQPALEGLSLLPEGSAEWYRCVGSVLSAAGFLRRFDMVREQIQALFRVDPGPDGAAAFMEAGMAVVAMTGFLGMREMAGTFLRRMQEVSTRLGDNEARARGILYMMTAWYALQIEGDVWTHRLVSQQACVALTAAGERRYLCNTEFQRHVSQANLGDYEPLRARFRDTLATVERIREPLLLQSARVFVGVTLLETGDPQYLGEVRALAEAVLATVPDPNYWTALSYGVLARVHAAEGDLQAAEQAARKAIEAHRVMPLGSQVASGILIRILLRQGRIEEAQAAAAQGLRALANLGGTGWMDVRLYVAAAEAHEAGGDREAARSAARTACDLIERRAASMSDPDTRQRYLALPDHAQARALASRL
ncbi:MAG TPA: protein kinase [Polyangia bacterium]|jgi:tetratricopeptide (TPR) repeat protein|nr:protein kinase [Polyangia bacterium]